MLIPGELANTTLGDVLANLHRAKLTGWLELTASHESPSFVFMRGGDPTFVASNGIRLGEVLGIPISPSTNHSELLGESLVRTGVAGAADVRRGLLEQTRRRLAKLFNLRRARLRFRPTVAFDLDPRANARAALAAPALAPQDYLFGRPRTRDTLGSERPQHPPHIRRALMQFGLQDHVGRDELRQRFRVRARAIHPDAASGSEDRAERERCLAQVSAAYHLLLTEGGVGEDSSATD